MLSGFSWKPVYAHITLYKYAAYCQVRLLRRICLPQSTSTLFNQLFHLLTILSLLRPHIAQYSSAGILTGSSIGIALRLILRPRLTLIFDFDALIADLESLWRCDGIAFVVAGSGTMAMEMGIANVATRGERVLVCSNGYFGDRYIEICNRKGFDLDTLKAEWGHSVTVEEVDAKLSEKKFDVLVVTHVETSTGVELPLKPLTEMLKSRHRDVLLIIFLMVSVSPRAPLTWARPVMPGLTLWRIM